MFKKVFAALLLSLSWLSFSSDQRDRKHSHEFHSITLPGQNGGGCASFRANNIVNTPYDCTSQYHSAQSRIDLGQRNCIRDFERQFNNDAKANATNKKRLFYGVSQGTATLTNWLAQKSHKEQEETAHGLVLEAVLGSGNSGIMQTASSSSYRLVTYLPFARLWLPLVAKAIFPTYNPLGKQALSSAKKLSPNIPVVIMHHEKDFQLDINDSREMYCTLREQGNKNAYLIETNNQNAAHFDILETESHAEKTRKIAGIQAIYQKHSLPHNQEALRKAKVNAEDFQPSVKDVRKKIDQSSWKQRYIRNAIDFVSAAAVVGYLVHKFWK